MSKLGWFGLIIGLGGGLVGVGVAVLSEMVTTGGFPGISCFIALLTFGILGVVFWSVFWPMIRSDRLLKTGEPAEATILKLWDTGVTLNENPQIGLRLEVRPPGRAPFQTETKMVVSRLQTSAYQPGQVVQVRYDPNNPKRVAVESVGGGRAQVVGHTVTVEGQTYDVDDLPPEAQQALTKAMQVLEDADGDGVPDIMQGKGTRVVDLQTPQSEEDQLKTLRELKGMLDAGLITAEDYEAKKDQILSRM